MNTDLRRAISHLCEPMESSHVEEVDIYVDLSFEGRTLQLRSDQVTVNNVARTFRLIPETIILVSDSGTVAIPDENGCFPDLDPLLRWTVEGDKSRSQAALFSGQSSAKSNPRGSKERWKPHLFPLTGCSAASKAKEVYTNVHVHNHR